MKTQLEVNGFSGENIERSRQRRDFSVSILSLILSEEEMMMEYFGIRLMIGFY